ncbi:MAG: glycosyltransferase [Candidatus Altiarchaeota archaeon]
MINVLEFTTTLEVGGTERMLSYLVRGLDKEKFNVSVACLTHGGLLADELSADGFDVTALKMRGKLDVAVIWRLYRLIREKRVDILHTYLFHANLIGRIVGKLAGVPVIISSERIMGLEGRYRLLLNRFTAPLTSALSCNSEAVKKFMTDEVGLPGDKITVIHNGVDLDKFGVGADRKSIRRKLGLKNGDVACMTVARLDRQKGVEHLIDAAAMTPGAKFLIAGEGPLKEKLEELAKAKGLGKSVTFLGLRRDIPELLKASDVFILPSLWEGFPNVVLEAMAAGLPVIATDTSGTPEAVVQGETGLLVSPANANALSDALKSMISNPERMREMGRKGRARAERFFSLDEMIRKNEDFYLKVLHRGDVA